MLHQFKSAAKFDKRTKNHSLWQATSHPIVCDTTEVLAQKIDYTPQDPAHAMIVARAKDYLFSLAQDYSGEKGLVDLEVI